MEQGSYLLIEPGMTVRGSDGDLGTVSEVIADEGVDVFRGIVLAHGLPLLTKKGVIVAERIVSVIDSVVRVDLSQSAVDALPTPEDFASTGT